MKTAIGIDIGGTKISVVLGTSDGKILARKRIPTLKETETSVCISEMVLCVRQLLSKDRRHAKNVQGIGVGIPGAVDSDKGTVPRSPHLKGWQGIKLRDILSKETGLPVIMTNDANAAAVAEKVFGSAKNVQDYIYITVSTGIGGGIIVHGRLLEGASFVAGEVGHMTIVPKGNLCKCGNHGCLEAYSSGTAIANYAMGLLRAGKRSSLSREFETNGSVTGRHVGMAAKKGDRVAVEAYEKAGYYLGVGVANLLNIINPAVITLGGGVWRSAPSLFFKAMIESAREHAWPEAFERARIMKSKLGDDVGDLGALALVFEHVGLSREKKPSLASRRRKS